MLNKCKKSMRNWLNILKKKRQELSPVLDAIKDVGNETHVLVYLEDTENTCVYVFKDKIIKL